MLMWIFERWCKKVSNWSEGRQKCFCFRVYCRSAERLGLNRQSQMHKAIATHPHNLQSAKIVKGKCVGSGVARRALSPLGQIRGATQGTHMRQEGTKRSSSTPRYCYFNNALVGGRAGVVWEELLVSSKVRAYMLLQQRFRSGPSALRAECKPITASSPKSPAHLVSLSPAAGFTALSALALRSFPPS